MSYKSRLLTTAFMLPVLMTSLPALALDIQTAVTVEQETTGSAVDDNGLHSISADGSVTITGPTTSGAAFLINHSEAVDVLINGAISVLDENADGTTKYDTSNQYGVWVRDPFTGDLTIGATASILLLDSLLPTDNDGDGILDGITRDQDTVDTADDVFSGGEFAQDSGRIGVFVNQAMTGNLFGLFGSQILVTADNGLGISITDLLNGNVDLRGSISVVGSASGASGRVAGVYIDPNASISGRYIQAGSLSATGRGASGIIVDGDITGSLQIEGSINATGYQTRSINNRGLLAANDETTLDANELQQGGSAVVLNGSISQGVLINGPIDTVSTADELTSLTAINTARSDGNPVDTLKTLPYHFDENRGTGRISIYGSAPAITMSNGNFGLIVEGFADTLDDDNDELTAFSGTTFAYRQSFINRGSITANGWNDGVAATAILIDSGADLNGGFLNAGSISASAYNNNATAISLGQTSLGTITNATDIFINNGSITASINSNTRTDATATSASYSAIAVHLAALTNLPDGAEFVNRGIVSASSTHIDGTSSVVGDNAIAFDFRAYTGDSLGGGISLRQSLLENDQLNGSNQFLGNGDLDLDLAGATDADGNVIGDCFVTSQDVARPFIAGDVFFSDLDDTLVLTTGSMFSNVYFGLGNDSLQLSNAEADPISGSSYEKPYTIFVGALDTAGGTLDMTMTGRSRMIFSNQEVVDEGVALTSLSISDEADLGFVVDGSLTTANQALVYVQNLTINGTDFKISPALENIEIGSYTQRFIQTASDLSAYSATINDHLSGTHPFLYNVALEIENIALNNEYAINARFDVKTAAELGLNTTQTPSLGAVVSHFSTNASLEAALTSFTNQADFLAAYDQILPQYGDGTLHQLSMLASSASGSISQHMQLVKAGGRSGAEGWVQQFGDFRKQDPTADTATVSGDSYSLAYGYDAPLLGLDALGLFTQLSYANIDEKSTSFNEVNSESWAIGAYLAHEFGPVGLELVAQTGDVKFDSERVVIFGSVSDIMRDGWDGTSVAASAKLTMPVLSAGRHKLQAEVGSDFFSLEQDAHTERTQIGTGLAMHLGEATSELTTSYFGLRGKADFGGTSPVDIKWSPNYYLGHQTVSTYKPYAPKVNFVGSSEVFEMKTADEAVDLTTVGFGIAAHNDYFAIELNYHTSFGDDVNVQGGGLAVRLKF